jgi:hypothetical protein
MIIILMILEVSFWNIYSTSITYDDHHDDRNIFIVQVTGDSKVIRMMPSSGISYDRHSGDSRVVIYAPREHL